MKSQKALYVIIGLVVVVSASVFYYSAFKRSAEIATILNANEDAKNCASHTLVGGDQDLFEHYQKIALAGGSVMQIVTQKDSLAFKVDNCTRVKRTGRLDGEFAVLEGENKGKIGWTFEINLRDVEI